MSQTYIHRFRNGIVATAKLSLNAFNVEWQGKPDKTIVPEYLRWRAIVMEDFATRTGKRILVVTLP
jgi:hypothetical protein